MHIHFNQFQVRTDSNDPAGAFFCDGAVLLLIYFCALGRCPVASSNFCWASICEQMVTLLQNVLINLGIYFSVNDGKLQRAWGSTAAANPDASSTIFYRLQMRVWCCCAVFLSKYVSNSRTGFIAHRMCCRWSCGTCRCFFVNLMRSSVCVTVCLHLLTHQHWR